MGPVELTYKNGVPYVVWCYWEGSAMNENRKKSFQYLTRNIGVPVFLVTRENLDHLIRDDHPLHPAFPFLSVVHRSDYIRAYLLHYYGGGWHDIKATEVSFADCWKYFKDPNIYLIGRPETPNGPAKVTDAYGNYMPDKWQDLVAVPAWIGRGNTDFTVDLLTQIEQVLDQNLDLLKKHPAKHPREKHVHARNFLHRIQLTIKAYWSGRNLDYPLDWTLFGNVFHPLVYKYKHNICRELPQDKRKNAGIYHR